MKSPTLVALATILLASTIMAGAFANPTMHNKSVSFFRKLTHAAMHGHD
jgi:hypothetical protein